MKSRINKQWIIEPSTTPLYYHRCSKCKKIMPYYCSEKFRVNAQKKSVDVWLIYKCEKCDNTFNIDIMSRVNPKLIDNDEYSNFQYNDQETAWKYSFDSDVINKNKVKADYSKIEYLMKGDVLSLKEILEQDEDLVEFEINIKFNVDLHLSPVIRKNLDLTVAQLEQMLSAGVISLYPPGTAKNSKVKNEQKVIVNKEKLKKYLSE